MIAIKPHHFITPMTEERHGKLTAGVFRFLESIE